jgi:DNA-binding transcriptional MerR regulator
MQVVTTREASRLTGLSKQKLREWTSRRALIPADVPPKNQGSPAKYSWQTILLLRVAVTLRDRFHLELQAHRQVLENLRLELRGASFIGLWGKVLVIRADQRWALADPHAPELASEDAILIRLAPHLEALSQGFSLPSPSHSPGQFDLFPIQEVADDKWSAVQVLVQPNTVVVPPPAVAVSPHDQLSIQGGA